MRIIQLCKKLLKEFIFVSSEYSIKLALYNLLWWSAFYIRTPFSFKISSFSLKKKIALLDEFIEKNYADIIEKCSETLDSPRIDTRTIWVFWWQGKEAMPPLVRACYRQLTEYNDGVVLITRDNIGEYLEVPDVIFDRLSSGTLSPTHFSDIVRNMLLAKYGGLWVDATVWVPGNVFQGKFEHLDFFSPNSKVAVTPRAICFHTSMKYSWSGWCMYAGKKNMTLFSFVSQVLCAVVAKHMDYPEYAFIDYLIHYASRKFPDVENSIRFCQGVSGEKRNALAEIMNEKYEEKKMADLTAKDLFFKLSYRSPWEVVSDEGFQTFYGKLTSDKL